MARRIADRVFDPEHPVYCRRPFIASGRHYKHGDHFDWTRRGVARRRVQQLFEAGKLMHLHKEPARVDDNTRTVATADGPMQVQKPDALDDINDMKELRRIADDEGAPYKVSKVEQRKAIRQHRQLEKQTRPDGDAPSSEEPSEV